MSEHLSLSGCEGMLGDRLHGKSCEFVDGTTADFSGPSVVSEVDDHFYEVVDAGIAKREADCARANRIRDGARYDKRANDDDALVGFGGEDTIHQALAPEEAIGEQIHHNDVSAKSGGESEGVISIRCVANHGERGVVVQGADKRTADGRMPRER